MKNLFSILCVLLGFASVNAQSEPEEFLKLRYATYAIDRFYVDSVNRTKLVEDAIVGMLKEMDPHSTYLNPEEVKEANEPLEGNFDGIGVQFNMLNDTLFIVNTIVGGPAEAVGVKAGDRIIAVNDTVIAGVKITNKEIMTKLRGKKGSFVDIEVLRRGTPEPIDFRIRRDEIPIYSIDAAYMADDNTGYIKVNRFAATTYEELKESLEKLRAQGMEDLILDLQGNGGGYLSEAINMANEFLDANQLIVYTEGLSQERQEAYSNRRGDMKDNKLVVIVDDSSASASEIVSGAIQDLDRGVIVGRRTFGKGLVQRPIPLPDGSMMRLTVARYYTPSGRSIQKPYEGGTDNYQKDLINRYNNGEMTNEDSIHFPDSLRYKTLYNDRTVYGGGGVMPDVFIPLDTTKYSKAHTKLAAFGVINSYVASYFDRNQNRLRKEYSTFEDFKKNFTVSDKMLDNLLARAKKDDLEIDPKSFKEGEDMLKLQIKALIARDLFSMSNYFQIMNDADESYIVALEVINDDVRYNKLLQ